MVWIVEGFLTDSPGSLGELEARSILFICYLFAHLIRRSLFLAKWHTPSTVLRLQDPTCRIRCCAGIFSCPMSVASSSHKRRHQPTVLFRPVHFTAQASDPARGDQVAAASSPLHCQRPSAMSSAAVQGPCIKSVHQRHAFLLPPPSATTITCEANWTHTSRTKAERQIHLSHIPYRWIARRNRTRSFSAPLQSSG
jgi:hypothetical protein